MDSKSLGQSIRDLQGRLGDSAAGRLWDAVAGPVADAITDIRQKVIEEPWFGRAVTPELVKEIDQPGSVHGTPAAALEGSVHGRTEPTASRDNGTPDGPTPEAPGPGGPRSPEPSETYREKIEALSDPANRSGQSFAEAVAERYGWGKDFWPMQKDIADHGRGQGPEQDHGVER